MTGKPAARVSDTNACPVKGHGHNPVSVGSPDVVINNLPAARVGDSSSCGDSISVGIASILINGQPVAHLGSATAHGGAIITGSRNVLVGYHNGSAEALTPLPFDEQFILKDSEGEPVAGFHYKITASSGRTFRGVTDEFGQTLRIHTPAAEDLTIEPDYDSITPQESPSSSPFDEQFVLKDAEGEPIAGFHYKITTSSGRTFRGVTDESGQTLRISTPAAEELTIEPDYS
jgi:uncharacterized Zn-binding protein involved in type VI secretion